MSDQTESEKARASRRGGEQIRSRFIYLIEGNYYSAPDVAKKLEISLFAAKGRIARLRKKEGALTFAKLRGES